MEWERKDIGMRFKADIEKEIVEIWDKNGNLLAKTHLSFSYRSWNLVIIFSTLSIPPDTEEHRRVREYLKTVLGRDVPYPKKKIEIKIPKDVRERIEEKIEEKLIMEHDEAMRKFNEELKNIRTIRFGIGGDTHKIYVACDDFSEEVRNTEEYNELMKKYERAIDLIILRSKSKEEWMKKLGVKKTDIRTALYNVLYDDGTWGEIDAHNPALVEAVKEIEEEEAEKKRKAEEKAVALEKKRREAIEEAKRTGKEVIIRKIGGYDGDDWDEVQRWGTPEIKSEFGDLGWVNVYEVATPDGKIKEKHVPSY